MCGIKSIKGWFTHHQICGEDFVNTKNPARFFFNLASLLRFGKTGNKKSATCLATLLQNELYGDVAQFSTHIKPVLQQIRLLTGLNEVVKRATSLFNSFCSNVAKQVARFSVPLDRGMQPINYNVPPRPIVSYNRPL